MKLWKFYFLTVRAFDVLQFETKQPGSLQKRFYLIIDGREVTGGFTLD